jgi:hypothetical protein
VIVAAVFDLDSGDVDLDSGVHASLFSSPFCPSLSAIHLPPKVLALGDM